MKQYAAERPVVSDGQQAAECCLIAEGFCVRSKTIADGKATDIALGLKTAFSLTSRDDAAAILISDGNDNVSADALEQIAALGKPVNSVLVGSDATESANIANVAVADVMPSGPKRRSSR